MDNSYGRLEDLDITREEIDRIGTALKDAEFRKMFTEYVEELENPENKKQFEEEFTLLEKERGVDVTFIHPKPGYVIKTSVNGSQKAFINICANEHINKPTSSPNCKDGVRGLDWSLPHSLSPPKEDIDNKRVRCQVYDVVFHPDTLRLAEKNNEFRSMLNQTACDAIEKNFDVTLDKVNLKFPKLLYKGMQRACVVRKSSDTKPAEMSPEEQEIYNKIYPCPYPNENIKRKPKKSPRKAPDLTNYTIPKYIIKHRSHMDIQEYTEARDAKIHAATPKELIIEISLPLLKSSSDITLDVTDKTVQLTSEKPAKYKLNLTLPYQVNELTGNAKFDKDKKKLIVTLPVKRTTPSMFVTDADSGVDSDHFSPGTPESSEDDCIITLSDNFSEKTTISDNNNVLVADQFRTKFLDDNLHYSIPEFSCHVFNNILAFTLHVKNVDENSIGKLFVDGSSIHLKFTSVSSSFYPNHYAFYVKLPWHQIDENSATIETWDNNVVVQLPYNVCDKELKSYFYGVNSDNLTEKYLEEPSIINQILEEERDLEEEDKSKPENDIEEVVKKVIDDVVEKCPPTRAIDIMATSYESSGDELSCSYSPTKNKGILKRFSSKRFSVGRSISESSLDDFVSSSFENGPTSLDSVIPEDGEVSTSLKKTVRFNDAIMRQIFRSNSSILGQKKKNQRKARNKKRAQERRHSESEASEVEEKKEEEGDLKTCDKDGNVGNNNTEVNGNTAQKEDFVNDIFHLDMDH